MKSKGLRSIAHYQVLETVYESLEGAIYKAIDTRSKILVYIKTYYPVLTWPDVILNEFFEQMDYIRAVQHEGVLPVLDVGQIENSPFVVFASPDSLTLLSQNMSGSHSPAETLRFMNDLASVLNFVHDQSVVHGTLHGGNIFIDPNGAPKIIDFGLSAIFKKLLVSSLGDSFELVTMADVYATAPEQILGAGATSTSDIYAFGMIAYCYAFGTFPFTGTSFTELAELHLQPGIIQFLPPKAKQFHHIVPLIEKCIQIDPSNRFSGFSAFLGVLNQVLKGRKPKFQYQQRLGFKHDRNLTKVFQRLIGILLLIIGGLFSLLFLTPDETQQPSVTPTAEPDQTIPEQSIATTTLLIPSAIPDLPSIPSVVPSPSPQLSKPAIQGEIPEESLLEISVQNFRQISELSRLGYGRPEDIAISSDSRVIAVATSTGVYLFQENSLLTWIDPKGWATSVQFSPDDSILAVGLESGAIQLWGWKEENKNFIVLEGHTGKITRIVFAKNQIMFSASVDGDIRAWDPDSTASRTIEAHSKVINDIAVTSDGRTLVSCSDDHLVRIWDAYSLGKKYEFKFDQSGSIVKALAISADDQYFAAAGESGFIRQWDLQKIINTPNPSLLARTDVIPVQQPIWRLQYSSDDQELIASLDDSDTLFERYVANNRAYGGQPLSFKIRAHPKYLVDIFGPEFDFDSSTVGFESTFITINWDGLVLIQPDQQILSPLYDIVDNLDWSLDGNILAVGGKRGSVNVWDTRTNQPLFQGLYSLPFGNPIAPDGSAVVIIASEVIGRAPISGNNIVRDYYQLKSLTGSQTTTDLSDALENGLVGYNEDGTVIISSSMRASKTWDVASGYETKSRSNQYNGGCRVTNSGNDGKNLQISSTTTILKFWDVVRADRLCPLMARMNNGFVAVTDSLERLVYINTDTNLLEAYDLTQEGMLWRSLIPKSEKVKALAISPSGFLISVGTESGQVIFLDGLTGIALGEIDGNFGYVNAVSFSHDGRLFATAGQDGAARIFGITRP